jgi:hypothetical protein
MNNNEFYVGYLPMPSRLRKKLIVLVCSAIIIVSAAGFIIASSQKKLKGGVFEYGVVKEVEGIFHRMPIPAIDVRGINGAQTTIPLVGYGKRGADGNIKEYERSHSVNLEGKMLTIQGSLIYRSGKTILEVENKSFIKRISATGANKSESRHYIDTLITGQIIDPKCYFGVMNPGEGKPHRECAIRCISGGIPPMFMVRTKSGDEQFYILRGKNGEDISINILDFVADAAEVKGRSYSYGNWMVMEMTSIQRLRDRK